MAKVSQLEKYMEHVCEALGHADRHAGFSDYGRALMLPIHRKSVEPLAAHTDPLNTQPSISHCITWWRSRMVGEAVMTRIREWVCLAWGWTRLLLDR